MIQIGGKNILPLQSKPYHHYILLQYNFEEKKISIINFGLKVKQTLTAHFGVSFWG
jgi:hypothetical protein